MCAVRWHVIPIPRPTGVKCLVACLYSHLRRRRAFILIAQPVAQFFRKGFGYAALQEHTASFSANRATHVTSVILRNPRTPLFSGASAPHTHTLTHSRTRTLYTDNQHFAIWSTSLKAGIFSVVLTEGLNCREVCNGNLCCVIAREEKIAKQRLFSPSLYTFLCLLFLCKKKSIFIIVFDVYVVLILSRLYFPPLLISYVCAVCGVSRRRWTFVSFVCLHFSCGFWKWAWTCLCGEVFSSPNILCIHIRAMVLCVGVPLRSPVNIQGFLHMPMHTIQL